MMRARTLTLALVLAALAATPPAAAQNIDLVTLPTRDTVQLTIYNSEDLTLVKETRHITLKKGANKLQFSWAGTLIDPTSVELRPLEQADKIEVADTVFPGQKPQHLIWNIDSAVEGQVRVEVSYFTSGLTWSMDYVGITDPDETKIRLRGYVRVSNGSGEEYDNAEVRLIVGTVNLVEKIADLARRQGIQPAEENLKLLRQTAARDMAAKAEGGGMGAPMPMAAPASKPPEIIKEGLSEYFMFSVEGRQTIPEGWSKRIVAVTADAVSFDIFYRMRQYQYGPRPVRFFIWRNDAEHKLGESPLPDGTVRLFRENGREGLSFLAEQKINYVPIKAEIEINLGPDDLVVYKTRIMDVKREAFAFERRGNNEEYVVGWDEQTDWLDTIRNYRTKPIRFELRRQWEGDVDYTSEVKSSLFDFHTVETTLDVKARDKTEYPCSVVRHHGKNQQQARVQLEK